MDTTREKHGGSLIRKPPHPYLHGNFAPVKRTLPLTPCTFTGSIPAEFAGGQYVRNGGNPVTNEDLGRDAHWFDGDGMLSGVFFRRVGEKGIQPEFVNQYILTDIYISATTTQTLRHPILPSIAALVNPLSSLLFLIGIILRAIVLAILSHLPGSRQAIKKISTVNTSILFHNGRALATCEAGPPMRINLPSLETIGWFDGRRAEGEAFKKEKLLGEGFGGAGLLSFMREWTTAHPRVDPITQELILFHSSFATDPYVRYSIIPPRQDRSSPKLLNAGVPGISAPTMMHDFGVSPTSTVIMELPLVLDPRNLIMNKPVITYDPSMPARFGVFPRWSPSLIRWYETSPCFIFHTANTWDESQYNVFTKSNEVTAVNMLACRLTTATLIYSAGHIAAPTPKPLPSPSPYELEEEQCRLNYYRFSMDETCGNEITHQYALSAIPFEFPSIRADRSMREARYIYGCTMAGSSFNAALGRAVKIDCLAKIDALSLIERSKLNPPKSVTGCFDTRTVSEILSANIENDCIQIFQLPPGWYAQEPRFVPKEHGECEDDGWIVSYVFNESQLDANDNALPDAVSELWIIDARRMKDVVCKIRLPQRVPYGLHGNWFPEADVLGQRPYEFSRQEPENEVSVEHGLLHQWWLGLRHRILLALG